jgi:hypothetical protein
MRGTFAAAAAALLFAATACAASSAGGSKPTLSLSRGKVHGTHFAARELVKVTFVGPAPRTQRRVRSNASGAFAAALPTAADPCIGPLVVVARGATGDTARMKLPQRACPPAAKQPGG